MTSVFASLVVFAIALTQLPSPASAIVVAAPTTTLSSTVAGATSTYTFQGYTTDKNRPLSYADVTFPAGTNVGGAVASLPNTTVAVTGPTTVRVTYTPRIAGSTPFIVAVGGIVNPAAGTYPANSVTIVCRTTNKGGAGAQNEPAATGAYTITTAPYLSMTITTPDDPGLLVDFGAIDPGVSIGGKQVTVAVTSSAAYTITRIVGGDATALGLAITGTATGAKPLGTATFTDDYTLNPPWTTDPEIPLTATVTYTVTQ